MEVSSSIMMTQHIGIQQNAIQKEKGERGIPRRRVSVPLL
jgi:hypothetical protein